MSPARSCLAVVLAAGEGQRMRSAQPKILHSLAGRTMLEHALASVVESGAQFVALVVGPGRDDVAAVGRALLPSIEVFVQSERLGTAHAVLAARTAFERGCDDLVVAFADTPLIQSETLNRLRAPLARGAAVSVLGFEPAEPFGYGRLLMSNGNLAAIREQKDADDRELEVRLCNAGLMALDGRRALALLQSIGSANAQHEYYLTDVVAAARDRDWTCEVVRAEADEVVGVNDRAQLSKAEALLQARLREKALQGGATLVDPSSVFLSWDTKLGRDVLIEPNVFFGPGVTVADGARILAFSHLVGAEIGPNASVGPFARLRPGAKIGDKAKIGNFVEIKAADVGPSAAISHLSYIGDAVVGARANIGAGTITCNYDGFTKQTTIIGEGAFIGSNSALVAPVQIGAGAYVGSGTVVTQNVTSDALALARPHQVEKLGWASAFRASKLRAKDKS